MPIRPALTIALLSLWVVVRPGASAALRGPSSDAIEAAARYVADYEEKLTSVLADETATQVIVPRLSGSLVVGKSRTVRSELFFMFEPLARQWMAIRDVMEVDGRPVTERPDLRAALRTLPASEVASAFKVSNSRFNIGRISRNFNEPTLALLVLDRSHMGRFRFEEAGASSNDRTGLVTLRFKERERPTLIAGLTSGAAYSQGEIVLDPGTGGISRTTLSVKADGIQVELETDYAPDPKLGMLVPARFREQYEHGGTRQLIRCEAKYSNYRRFEVTSRIK